MGFAPVFAVWFALGGDLDAEPAVMGVLATAVVAGAFVVGT